MKNLIVWCLVILLDIPMSLWVQIPQGQRQKIEMKLIVDFCKGDMYKCTKWRIDRKIVNWNYQIHIESLDQKI